MAQFRGTIQGTRGEASRLGTKSSGLTVTANGWDTGVRVELDHETGQDRVTVWRTGGSNGGEHDVLLAQWFVGTGQNYGYAHLLSEDLDPVSQGFDAHKAS